MRRPSAFGIVHGGVFPDLRRASAEYLRELPFDGLCIGGSLGENKQQMREVVDMTVPHMPDHLPRHLLGIGDVDDLIECVARGIDMFDCVTPDAPWSPRHGAGARRGTLLEIECCQCCVARRPDSAGFLV